MPVKAHTILGKKGIVPLIVTIFCIALIVYFSYHAIQGERGLLTWARLDKKIVAIEPRLKRLQERRVALENRVSLLRSVRMDADMLEERARVMLNYGYRNDVIILLGREDIRPADSVSSAGQMMRVLNFR